MESRKPGVSQLHGIGGASAPRARGIRFSQLSVPRQALVRLCQATNYGQIHHLEIRDSDPVLNPPPLMLADIKQVNRTRVPSLQSA